MSVWTYENSESRWPFAENVSHNGSVFQVSPCEYCSCPYCKTEMSRFCGHRNPSHLWGDDGMCGGEKKNMDFWVFACKSCGWWIVLRERQILDDQDLDNVYCGGFWDVVVKYEFVSAQLRELDIITSSEPLEEIRRYLEFKYERRFEMSPRLFEEVVADVFRSIGYSTQVTGYQGDGGIDVILTRSSNDTIGVQVKRYKNRISVENIRAFLGAIVLKGYTKGVFITTSSFQSGCQSIADKAAKMGFPIELIDGDRFLTLMGTKKRAPYKSYEEWMAFYDPLRFKYGISPTLREGVHAIA